MPKETIQAYSAGAVTFHHGKVLLIKWLSHDSLEFPKGTIEPGETSEAAAIREVKEETGYTIRLLQPLPPSVFDFDWEDGNRYQKTVYYYLAELADTKMPVPARLAHEDFENIWLTPHQALRQLTYDDSREVLTAALDILNR